MPLKRRVLLQTINLTSLILPTEEKNSSTSLALTRCDSCITKIVRASLSSGVRLMSGDRSFLGSGEADLPNLPPIPPSKKYYNITFSILRMFRYDRKLFTVRICSSSISNNAD